MVRRTAKVILDIIEIYIPVISFVLMFSAFLLEIFFRYVLNNPLTWPFEITTVSFVWTVMFGAIYAMRKRDHIAFSLLYDAMSPRVQLAMRFISNGMIFVGFALLVGPAYQYVSFMHMQSTPDFNIPFTVVYFPFVVFVVMVMYYTLYDIIVDIKKVMRGEITKDTSGSQTSENQGGGAA